MNTGDVPLRRKFDGGGGDLCHRKVEEDGGPVRYVIQDKDLLHYLFFYKFASNFGWLLFYLMAFLLHCYCLKVATNGSRVGNMM
jgi:hypothetical protein